MSGFDSDLGGFNSPAKAKPSAPAKPSSSRPQAGPSRSVAAGRKAITVDGSADEDVPPPVKKGKPVRSRKQPQREVEEVVEEEDAVVEVEEAELVAPQPKPKARAGLKKNPPAALAAPMQEDENAATAPLASGAAKGKGKPRAKPPSKPRTLSDDDVEMVDPADEQMDMEVEDDAARANQRAAPRGPKNAKPHPQLSAMQDEIARLKDQLSRANSLNSDLTRQLGELMQVRHTEPEQLLERIEAQHQVQVRAHEKLVEELMAQLAQNDPLLRSTKKGMFEVLTREEANKESEKLHNQVKSYRDALQERDAALKERDARIETLEQDKKDLQLELKMEIERAKALATQASKNQRPPGSATRSAYPGTGLATSQDPKHSEIIKFYEDLTNILIPSVKSKPGRFLATNEWVLNCIYTYKDVTDKDAEAKSIMFNITLCHDLRSGESEPVVDMDQLVESVHYTPRDLDKETPEFVQSLGFLNDNFTFERDQLSLFLRTLHDNISGEGKDGEEDGDESVVVVN